MLRRVPRLLALVCLIGALGVAGCGGGGSDSSSSDSSSSSSSSQSASSSTSTGSSSEQQLRNQFIRAVTAKLGSSGLPADYINCVTGKAKQIPVAQLKALGSAAVFSDKSQAAKALGERLGKQCIAEGAGVAAFRQVFIGSIKKGLAGSGLSSAYRSCVIKKADTEVSNAQLSSIILTYLASGPSSAQAAGQKIGKKIGQECISEGAAP
jgi:hypothetical protein